MQHMQHTCSTCSTPCSACRLLDATSDRFRLAQPQLFHLLQSWYPGEKANVWAFNYFFYNKKLKRILYLSCRAVTKATAEVRQLNGAAGAMFDRARAGAFRGAGQLVVRS